MEWDRSKCNGMEVDGMGWEWCRWDGMGEDGIGVDGMAWE
jgi:hypothetical protein